jgi:hypothetical protein
MDMTIEQFCDKHGACAEGREWALANCQTMRQAFETAKPEWAIWIATRPGVPIDRDARLFACWCVRQVWNLLTDERSRAAVEVAERFADGKATAEELSAAASAARAARAALAARAASYAAIDASFSASDAARAAAYAAAYAAARAARASRDAARAADAADAAADDADAAAWDAAAWDAAAYASAYAAADSAQADYLRKNCTINFAE